MHIKKQSKSLLFWNLLIQFKGRHCILLPELTQRNCIPQWGKDHPHTVNPADPHKYVQYFCTITSQTIATALLYSIAFCAAAELPVTFNKVSQFSCVVTL